MSEIFVIFFQEFVNYGTIVCNIIIYVVHYYV